MIQDATITAFKTHTCVEIRCNVCGYIHDEDDDGIRHFDNRAAAIEQVGYYGWTATAETIADDTAVFDGYAICSTDDAVHDAARHWLSTRMPSTDTTGYALKAGA